MLVKLIAIAFRNLRKVLFPHLNFPNTMEVTMKMFPSPLDMESQLIEHTELASEEIITQLELGYAPGRLMVLHLVWITQHKSLVEWIEKSLEFSGWTALRLNNPEGETYALAVYERNIQRLCVKSQYFEDPELRPDILEVLSRTGWCIEGNGQESEVYFKKQGMNDHRENQDLSRLFSIWRANRN